MPPFLLAFVLAALVAAAAWRARALTPAGAVAACIVGTAIFARGGWAGAGALLMFFATSTGLSRWRRQAKESLGYEKGGRRDAGQVLANGGVAAACLLLPLFSHVDTHRAFGLMLGALAAANADTWATEIGSALGAPTIDLRTGRAALPGTSGAVSLPGTLAALGGAALLGCFAGSAAGWGMVTAAGLAGALADSGLGATVQAQWRDPALPGRWTEQAQGQPPARGWAWVGNDAVNLACTGLGALGVFTLQKIILGGA